MKKRFSEAQIIGFLREAEAGLPVKQLCRRHEFSEASYYLCRAGWHGGQNRHPRWHLPPATCTPNTPRCQPCNRTGQFGAECLRRNMVAGLGYQANDIGGCFRQLAGHAGLGSAAGDGQGVVHQTTCPAVASALSESSEERILYTGMALLHGSSLARTMPTNRILTCR